jgi:hypothetical protein
MVYGIDSLIGKLLGDIMRKHGGFIGILMNKGI